MVILHYCWWGACLSKLNTLTHESCIYKSSHLTKDVPDSKVHRANMGHTWVLSAPDGPHVGPMNLVIRGHTILCAYDLSIISLKGLSLLYNQSVIYIILPHWEEILTWKRFMHYWTFVRAIHWSTVVSFLSRRASDVMEFGFSEQVILNRLLDKEWNCPYQDINDSWNRSVLFMIFMHTSLMFTNTDEMASILRQGTCNHHTNSIRITM